jgi:Flp pilus assembly protein TadG
LLVPLLSTFLIGIIEFGTLFYSYSAMQFAATAAARQFAVNVSSEADALAAARDILPGWARDDIAVSLVQSDAADPNRNVITVRMSVDAAAATPLAMITRAVPWTLRAESSVKQELPYVD